MVDYTYDGFMKAHLGTLGPYQIFLATLASLDAITTGYYVMVPVFIANIPPHTCSPPAVPYNCSVEDWQTWGIPTTCTEDGTCVQDSCQMYQTNMSEFVNCSYGGDPGWTEAQPTEPCRAWNYGQSFYPDSTVREWDLVCGRKGFANTVAGVYMLGRCTGSFLLGWVADKFGRRRAMLSMTALTFAAALGVGFAPNLYVFLGLRFIMAVCDMTRSNTGFILGMEYLHSSRRAFFVGFWGLLWVVGCLSLAALAYFIQQWRHLLIVLAIPEVLLFIIHLIALPESPRWLLLHNRKEDAKNVIRKIAKFNRKTLPEDWDINIKEETVRTASMKELIRSPRIAVVTLVMAYIFFANSFVFYGLSLNTSNLAGDEYINFFISGAIEVPAYILIAVFYEGMARKPPYCICLIMGGVLLLTTLVVPSEMGWLQVVLCMTGKFFIAITFMMTWLVVAEIFPTAVRVLGLGVTNGMARIGGLLSSYVALLVPMPSIFFSMVAILAGLLVLIIPETRGIVLPQTVREGESFLRTNMCKIGNCRMNKETTAPKEIEVNRKLFKHAEAN